MHLIDLDKILLRMRGTCGSWQCYCRFVADTSRAEWHGKKQQILPSTTTRDDNLTLALNVCSRWRRSGWLEDGTSGDSPHTGADSTWSGFAAARTTGNRSGIPATGVSTRSRLLGHGFGKSTCVTCPAFNDALMTYRIPPSSPFLSTPE